MPENLFSDLPPPSTTSLPPVESATGGEECILKRKVLSPAPPPPALKGALKKREKASDTDNPDVPQKRLRFKTTVDASESQVIEAMQKIASHISNPAKFSKASKLTLQLIQAGSVKAETSDYFYGILEAAMSSTTSCTDTSLRADYAAMFSSVQEVASCFTPAQKNQVAVWTIKTVVVNDLYTDDSFVFSKASARLKETISSLPVATEDDDGDEELDLAKGEHETEESQLCGNSSSDNLIHGTDIQKSDPFGLDSLLPTGSRKDSKGREKSHFPKSKPVVNENKRFLKAQREALILCLDIAARRYKIPWCQTAIDILVKHAFDNISRFTAQQRSAIEKLWASVREQMNCRKQGKTVSGKLDVNAFEMLQGKYANEKISIRRAVGGGGDRRAQQWLG